MPLPAHPLQRALQQARSGAKPLLPLLLPSLLGLYRSTLAPCCLDTLAVIMETFGEVQGNPDLAAAQQQALTGGATSLQGAVGGGLYT